MHPTKVVTAEKLLRRGGRPHMDLQRQHHRTATLVRRSSTTSRHEDQRPLLPRVGDLAVPSEGAIMPFLIEQERVRTERLVSRVDRDRIFRRVVLQAYDERCAKPGAAEPMQSDRSLL